MLHCIEHILKTNNDLTILMVAKVS